MKFRTTLILLALVIGLGAFLIFFSLRQPSAKDYKERDSRVFPAFEFQKGGEARKGLSDLATRIELRNGKDAITLERDAKSALNWRITSPVSYPADSGIVSSILSEIEFLTAARVIDPAKQAGLDLAGYGLAAPEQSIALTIDGRVFKVDLGAKTTDGNSAYVTTEKKLIYVVPKSVLAKAATRLNELRDKTVLRFEKSAVTRLSSVAPGKPALELVKEKAAWKMLQPAADETDGAAVTKLIEAVSNLRIAGDDFLTDKPANLADYGLAAPALTLAVFEGDKRRSLLIGGPAKDRAGKLCAMTDAEPVVFALEQKDLDALPKAADLRCRTALPVEAGDVTKLEIAGRAPVVLSKTGEEWKMTTPAGQSPSSDAVRAFLTRLTGLEVRDRLDDATPERLKEAGLDAPRATVTISTKDGEVRKLLFGAEKAGKLVSVRRGTTGPILTVPADILSDLDAGYVAFVSRRVLDLQRDQVTGVSIVGTDRKTVLEKRDRRWLLTEPVKAEPKDSAVDQLLWAVTYLEAQKVVSDKPEPATYGFDAPRFKVTITLSAAEGKSETKVLLIGKETPDGLFATVEGGRYVYAVSKDIVKQLTAELAPAAQAPATPPAATPAAPVNP